MGLEFSGKVSEITYLFADIRKLLQEAEIYIKNLEALNAALKKKIEELEK